MENKLVIMIVKTDDGKFKTMTRIDGDPDIWWKNQLKRNQAKANSITSANNIFTGQEDVFFYEGQLKKFLKRYDGLKNVEVVKA